MVDTDTRLLAPGSIFTNGGAETAVHDTAWDDILATANELARSTQGDATSFALFARLAYRVGWHAALDAHGVPEPHRPAPCDTGGTRAHRG